jgi:glycine cleavage system transcriptional repressor
MSIMTAVLNSHLVITALGPDKPNIVHQLTNSLTHCGGNILDTRMTTLGSEFGVMLLIEGSWGAIAKIEANLFILEERLGITINVRRTTPKQPRLRTINYLVHVVTIDREGIINDLAKFFSSQHITIEDINAHTYFAHTGTRMSSMTININISVNTHLPTLREQFMLYCDALNLDASLEPLRD